MMGYSDSLRGLPPPRPCCEPMKMALQGSDGFCALHNGFCALHGESQGENVVWLSADGGSSTLCEIEFCPWCGTEIRFGEPSVKEYLDDVSSGKMMG